jgi:hypothetical protein
MRHAKEDLVGRRFGALLVKERAPARQRAARWRCVCDCGGEAIVTVYNLLNGHSRSCGCRASKNAQRHGHAAGGRSTPTFRSWLSMVRRCTDPKFEPYARYGAVGVTVCPGWLNFENFLADMGERPDGTSIDRFPEQSGNYEPGNCRWASAVEQANNRSSTKLISARGEQKSIADWARASGTPASRIASRLRAGWSAERAIFGGDR